MIQYKIPTNDSIDEKIKKFDSDQREKEAALQFIFEQSGTEEAILAQAYLLNALYSTHVDYDSLVGISKAIYKKNIIDKIITIGRESSIEKKCKLVQEIAGYGKKSYVSFASKFCNWVCLARDNQNCKSYPISDCNSRKAICIINNSFMGKSISETICNNYRDFFLAYIEVHEKYASKYSYKNFDKYLWSYVNSESDTPSNA